MSRPSWVQAPVFESDDEPSASGVCLADDLVPPPMPGDAFASQTADCAPAEPEHSPSLAPQSGVVRIAAPVIAVGGPASDAYDQHLDHVVSSFFPGWGPRSPRASRPNAAPHRK